MNPCHTTAVQEFTRLLRMKESDPFLCALLTVELNPLSFKFNKVLMKSTHFHRFFFLINELSRTCRRLTFNEARGRSAAVTTFPPLAFTGIRPPILSLWVPPLIHLQTLVCRRTQSTHRLPAMSAAKQVRV